MDPKPQKWRRSYETKVLTIYTDIGGIWEIDGDVPRSSSKPSTSVEWMQSRADQIARERPSGPWQRICRVCDEPMRQLVDTWVCKNLHEEQTDED